MKISSFTKPSNSFSGNVLKLVSGTTFAQAISILTAPILTRLYAPEAFGIVALFTSIAGILGVIVCLRYEMAIMLPERDEEAANLLGVCLGFTLLISLLLIPIVWCGRAPLVKWLNAPSLESYLWLVPLVVFISGVFLALNYWNSRTKHFGRLSIATVTSSLTYTPLTLGLGLAGRATAGSMIGAGIAGQAVATSVLGGQIWRDDRSVFLKSIRWRLMWMGMKRHKKFPLINTWSALMNTMSASLPTLMLAAFFSSTVVGFYALGYKLLSLPMSLIAGAIGQVFFQRAAKAKNEGTLPLVVERMLLRHVSLGLFPLLLVMVIGKDIFSVIFGNQWADAGVYAQILAPLIMFQYIGSPLSTLFSVLEIQGAGLLFNSILLVTRIASLVIGGFLNSILLALMLFAITGAIMYFGFCLFLLKKSGVSMSMLVSRALQMFVIVVISLLPVAILKGFGAQSLIAVIAGCLSLPLYYLILYLRDDELKKLVADFWGRRKSI